jgi:low temperature requirement protein LtrA
MWPLGLADNGWCRVVISIVEGLLIFLIAIIWRILSFKYTHLVERLQLLTLIIIGEGIIGMVKSVAGIFKMQSDNNATEVGTVVAAMLLLVSVIHLLSTHSC